MSQKEAGYVFQPNPLLGYFDNMTPIRPFKVVRRLMPAQMLTAAAASIDLGAI